MLIVKVVLCGLALAALNRSTAITPCLVPDGAEKLAGWIVAPHGLRPRKKIGDMGLRWRRHGHNLGDDGILLDLHFLPGGNPAQDLRPLLRHLLGAGGLDNVETIARGVGWASWRTSATGNVMTMRFCGYRIDGGLLDGGW
jgi:hypothetical protein